MFTQYNYFKDLIDDHGKNFRIATDIAMRQDFKKWLMKYSKRNYEFISSRAKKESVPKKRWN